MNKTPTPPLDIDLAEMMNDVRKVMESYLREERPHEVAPQIHLVTLERGEDGPSVEYGMMILEAEGSPVALLPAIGKKLADDGVILLATVLTFEAWITTHETTDGVPPDPATIIPPRHDPQRRECLTLDGATYTGTKLYSYIPLARDDSGGLMIDQYAYTPPMAEPGRAASALLWQAYSQHANAKRTAPPKHKVRLN